MRVLVVLGVLAVFAVLRPVPALAYAGTWCAIVNYGGGVVQERCGIATFEACRREAAFYGSSSFCRPSQYDVAEQEKPPRKPHRRRAPRHR